MLVCDLVRRAPPSVQSAATQALLGLCDPCPDNAKLLASSPKLPSLFDTFLDGCGSIAVQMDVLEVTPSLPLQTA